MKMITKKRFILDEKEIKAVHNCLNYCYHRMTEHGKLCIGSSREGVDKLRKEIQESLNK